LRLATPVMPEFKHSHSSFTGENRSRMSAHFVILMEAVETWLADSDGNLRPPDIPRTHEIDCLRRKKPVDKLDVR
jgi:hypothetical protein